MNLGIPVRKVSLWARIRRIFKLLVMPVVPGKECRHGTLLESCTISSCISLEFSRYYKTYLFFSLRRLSVHKEASYKWHVRDLFSLSLLLLISLRMPLKVFYPFVFLLGSQICPVVPVCLWRWLYGKKEEIIPGNWSRTNNLFECERQRTAHSRNQGGK